MSLSLARVGKELLWQLKNIMFSKEPARRRRREERAGLGAIMHRQAWRSLLAGDDVDPGGGGVDPGGSDGGREGV